MINSYIAFFITILFINNYAGNVINATLPKGNPQQFLIIIFFFFSITFLITIWGQPSLS